MLDIGWSEMAVVALVALIVIGPKELPQAMRAASKWVRKARSLAREFQSGVDDMIREADLEDARKTIQDAKRLDLDKALEETVDPDGAVGAEASDLERTARAEGTEHSAAEPKDKRAAEAEGGAKDGAEAEGARVVEQPLSMAPAHSIKPPAEAEAVTDTGSNSPSKSA